jgi:hypothetical protein
MVVMPHRRIAQFRTASRWLHEPRGRDRLDRAATATAVLSCPLVNIIAVIPMLEVALPEWTGLADSLAFILICVAINLVTIRGTWVTIQHSVRPWLFDREQRNNEIVPRDERSHTGA